MKILFIGAVDQLSEVQSRLRPLWPSYLAAYLQKHLGSGKCHFRFATRKIRHEIKNFKPDIVAISSVSQNYGLAREYAQTAKQYGLPVVVGGMHITTVPRSLTDDMDIGCIGEGEQTFLEIVKLFLETGFFRTSDLSTVNGIVYRDGGRLVQTPARAPIAILDELPHPDRSLTGYGRRGYLTTARGCAYQCIFCSCTRHWGQVRYASPAYIMEELRDLIGHEVKIIRFNDDNFAANKQRLYQISELVVKNGFHRKARFSCWCRSNNITPEVVQALKAMNVVSVKMGLESGCDRTLDYLKGHVTVKDNWNAVNLLKNAGIRVNADFIIGAPAETEQEMMQTYEFIRTSRLDFVDINVLTPLPGTPLYEDAFRKKIVTENMDFSVLNFKFSKNSGNAPILSETMTRQQLHRIYKKFLRLRFLKSIKAIRGLPWTSELPYIVFKRFAESIGNIFKIRFS